MNDTTKRYLFSSGVTFLSAFFLSLAFNLDKLSLETMSYAAVGGLLLTAARAGIKALAEFLTTLVQKP